MEIILSSTSGRPIYEQITLQIKEMIMKGDLAPGQALPSMRKLAKDLHVSVIQRSVHMTICKKKDLSLLFLQKELLFQLRIRILSERKPKAY
mgnify:CR=1 FL=1